MKTSEPSGSLWQKTTASLRLHAGSACSSQASRESALMMVVHVLTQEAPQIAFIQCAQLVGKLVADAAAASDRALLDPVLPGSLHAGAFRLQAR